MTGEATDLYRDPDGIPRLTLAGWPLPGTLVATFEPEGRRRSAPIHSQPLPHTAAQE